MKNNKKNEKGFVVLYTVLVASIVLAITLGISLVSYNELVLSIEAREGNAAFFAADTGMECALYLDLVNDEFTNLPPQSNCEGQSLVYDVNASGYPINLNYVSGTPTQCAVINVNKNYLTGDPSNPCDITGGAGCTRIESRGYNVSCADKGTSPRAIERAVRTTYTNSYVIEPPPPPPPPPPPSGL